MYGKQGMSSSGNQSTKHKRHQSHASIGGAGKQQQVPSNQLHQYQEGTDSNAQVQYGRTNKQGQAQGSSKSEMMQDLVKHFNKGALSKTDLKLLQKYCEQKGLNYQSVILGAAAAAQNTASVNVSPAQTAGHTPSASGRHSTHQSVVLSGASGGAGVRTSSQQSMEPRDKYASVKYGPSQQQKGETINQYSRGPSPEARLIKQQKNHQPNIGNYSGGQQIHTASNGYFSQQHSPARLPSGKSGQQTAPNSGKQTPEMMHGKHGQGVIKKQSMFVYENQVIQANNPRGSQERPSSSHSRGHVPDKSNVPTQNVGMLYESWVQAQSSSIGQKSSQPTKYIQRTGSQPNITPAAQAQASKYKPLGVSQDSGIGKKNPFKRQVVHSGSQGSLDNKKFGSAGGVQGPSHHSAKVSVSGQGSVVHQNNYMGSVDKTTSPQGVAYPTNTGQKGMKVGVTKTSPMTQQQAKHNSSGSQHKRVKSKNNSNAVVKTKQYSNQSSMPSGLVQHLIHGGPLPGSAAANNANHNTSTSNPRHHQYQHRSGAMTSAPNSPQGNKNHANSNRYPVTKQSSVNKQGFVLGASTGPNSSSMANIHVQSAVNSVTNSQSSLAAYLHQTNSNSNQTSGTGQALGQQRKGSVPHNQAQSKISVQKGGKQNQAQSQKQSPTQLHSSLHQQQYGHEYLQNKPTGVKMHHSLHTPGVGGSEDHRHAHNSSMGYSSAARDRENNTSDNRGLQKHQHSSSQPTLAQHVQFKASNPASSQPQQVNHAKQQTNNTQPSSRKNLREMTPQLLLNKNASAEVLHHRDLTHRPHHAASGAQKSSGRVIAASSSVHSTGSNGVQNANGGGVISQLQQQHLAGSIPTPTHPPANYQNVRSSSIPQEKRINNEIKPVLHKNNSQASLRASMGSNSNNYHINEPYTQESQRKKLMLSGGSNSGTGNNSLQLSEQKKRQNAQGQKTYPLQAQYVSDQSTGAQVRRKTSQQSSSRLKNNPASGSGMNHYKNRVANKNTDGVAPYDQSNQSKGKMTNNNNSIDDSMQKLNQANYSGQQHLGIASQLNGSEGSKQFAHKQEFMSQPHLGPGVNQPAPVNLSLASVSSAAGSQKYLAQQVQSHKRTSSVTNQSSQRTGSLVGATSGRRGSQQESTPHAQQNHHKRPQAIGQRRLSAAGSQGSQGEEYSKNNLHRPQKQMQVRSDQRKPPGPIKEHLLEDSPNLSSLEQFQFEIGLRHEQNAKMDSNLLQPSSVSSFNKKNIAQKKQNSEAKKTSARPSSRRKEKEGRAPIRQISSQQSDEDILQRVDNTDIISNKPLLTEEEEQGIRQVASDINERAFYGKIMKTKRALRMPTEFAKLSPRSQEIGSVMRAIKMAFDETGIPPTTMSTFYRIGKVLGRGAFGKVNLAMHKLVRKLVALKSLNKEQLTDVDQKTKLMKEVNLLLKLRHNNVVKIYETIETEKHIIIVMELCAGGDLLNYVRKRRKLKEPFAQRIFKQIIDGLHYTHNKLVAHRDIKLDNILLDGKGNVKIADFGVSKQTTQGNQMREQCGTPAYIAPEILRNKGYGLNVDLWSAGVVLFAMLYGTVPFKAPSMNELHQLILKGKYTLKEDISLNARSLLRGLLEIDPTKRLTIKQIYEHPWLKGMDNTIQLFNDEERQMIKKEYTYNDASRYNRNENEEPVDCFTEHNFESVYSTLKNHSSKSIILAPFNSTMSDGSEEDPKSKARTETDLAILHKEMEELMEDKQRVMRFSKKCREIDRQYEFNNNGQLDNGVYHKNVANNSFEQKSGEDSGSDGGIEIEQSMTSAAQQKDGKGSVAVNLLQKQLRAVQQSTSRTEDAEMVVTYETIKDGKEKRVDDAKIDKLCSFGYPQDYVQYTMAQNEPNYCTAGYYLLDMDQNYC